MATRYIPYIHSNQGSRNVNALFQFHQQRIFVNGCAPVRDEKAAALEWHRAQRDAPTDLEQWLERKFQELDQSDT